MAANPRRNLFRKYALQACALVGILLLASGALSGYFTYLQAIDGIETAQRLRAAHVAGAIDAWVARVEGSMRAVVDKFPASGEPDVEDARSEIAALLRHQASITDAWWVRPDGREWLALSRMYPDAVDSGRDWSTDPRYVATRNARSGAGPILFRNGEPYLSLVASREAGGPRLVAEVNLKFVSEAIAAAGGGPDVIYVVDERGRMVSHSDVRQVLRNADLRTLPQVRAALEKAPLVPTSNRDARALDGSEVLSTAVAIPRLRWTVHSEQPLDVALEPAHRTMLRAMAMILLGLIAAVAASLAFARSIVQPIHAIEAGARELGEGRLDRRIDVRTGDDLELLADQFNRMAARLQSIYEDQERRIDERTRDLASANESKSRFLAAASHDLRQPMHALSLFVGQLRHKAGTAEAPVLLEKIESSVEALQELLEALLDLSKLDIGAVTAARRPFALGELIGAVAVELAPIAEAKGLALTAVPTRLWAFSDVVLVRRILVNVVTNAIRYTHAGRILVGCRRRGDSIDVLVVDTGSGIGAEHLPHVFEEFYRAGGSDAAPRGLGLGLAIVKRLAELLDVEVGIRSVVGRGTSFRLRLPRASPQRAPSGADEPAGQGLHAARILVIDDDDAVRDAMQGLLRSWGCDVVAVGSGGDALARVATWRPDAVLCDFTLPGDENGLVIVERLRDALDVPPAFAFVTGETTAETLDTIRRSGYPLIVKPAKPAKLRALLEHLLASRRAGAPEFGDLP
jgi:signal transduction histidine kinase/ActR/RegA family two-component response regulator